ncbi:hypothetical protein HUJ04_012321 [Dendroctonus ponderosae]|uniref:C2H2-type domain-containing protein n=1 Tax=Dendroctonus ponderosae TaxID=77166 RepID=A0AAR5PHK7_DENPD|nr:hypothetical protein HUJ04_012321 [Dendroctonus ponderosae]
MNRFIENYCRLCPKAFCCKNCRCKHETDYHSVISQCDICIYGTFVFENIDENILQHIKETHLPLNCLYCKRVFSCIEEIIQHKKCPVHYKSDSPKTPLFKPPEILISADDQDSPILQELQRNQALNFIFKLATSTPMQNTETENFHKSKDDAITPSERFQISNKSIIKKTQTLRKSDESSKRRVTFSETTGTTHSIEYNSHETEQTYSSKNPHILEDESANTRSLSTPDMAIKAIPADEFYSAKSEINQSSVKVQKSRYDGNKTSVMNLEDISTPVCIPKQSEIVRSQLDIYKDVKVKDAGASNQIHSESDNDLPSEVKQIIRNNNGSEMEICSPISEEQKMVPSLSAKFPKTELSDSESLYTPKMVLPTETFYSAKSEVDKSPTKKENSKSERKKNSLLQYDDISTPVCAPKSYQGVSAKVEIKEAEDTELDIADQTSCKSSYFLEKEVEHASTNIHEISMELCSPYQTSYKRSNSLANEAEDETTNSHEKSTEMCSTYLTNAVTKQQTVSTEAKVQILHYTQHAKLKLNDDSDSPNKMESDSTEDRTIYTPASQTLWHSATNLEDNDSDKENIPHDEDKDVNVDLVKETEGRRVSIVMPTPVLKRTDVQMKIRLPVHFASTPVSSIEEVKEGPVSAIENVDSRVPPRTPYETPQASCSQFIGMKTFGSRIEPYSKIEAGPSNIKDKFGSSSAKHGHNMQKEMGGYHQINGKQNITETSVHFTSTSSMTESNLWSSMTRVVRSVLGLSKKNEDCSVSIVSTSMKRQLSEEEMDVFELPQRKRFKYSDIKGRKPIRSASLLLPTLSSEVATFEFVGSVRTLYNCARTTKCDKYTQTDDSLMYAWFSSNGLQ